MTNTNNPKGVAVPAVTTPLGLVIYDLHTQGSAFGATLGFMPEPLRG